MADPHSKGNILKALIGNGAITVVKFFAWLASGSGSMLSEAIHSLVDTLNQGLLLIGETRSLMKPTAKHPYGFGMEANYWGLLAAMGILAFGGGISIQHGIEGLSHEHGVPTNLGWAIGVLILALLVESWVLFSVMKDLNTTRGSTSWWKHLSRQSAGTITVLLEDLAAVLGCIIAGIMIGLWKITGNGIYDAVGQIIIGCLLVLVGVVLLWRGRTMLIGQSIPTDQLHRLRVFLEDLEGIERVTDIKTRLLSNTHFRVKAEVVFSGGFLAARLVDRHAETFQGLTNDRRVKELLGRYADEVMREQAHHVDYIEQEIRKEFPGAMNIDLEPHLSEEE
jgi:zinc transporter 9